MKNILLFTLFLLCTLSYGQDLLEKYSIEVIVAGTYTHPYLPSGTGVSFSGPPYIVGDLSIEYKGHWNYGFEARLQKRVSKSFTLVPIIGFNRISFENHWDYNYAESIHNLVGEYKKRYYLSAGIGAKYYPTFAKKKLSLTLAPLFDYMAKSHYITDIFLNGKFITFYDTIDEINRYNVSYQLSIDYRIYSFSKGTVSTGLSKSSTQYSVKAVLSTQ